MKLVYDFIAKNSRRRQVTQIESILRKRMDEFIKNYKRKPSIREFEKYIEKVDRDLFNEMQSSINHTLRRHYERVQVQTSKELGTRLSFTNRDALALSALQSQQVLSDSISGLRDKTTSKLKEIFEEMYRQTDSEFTLRRLKREIKELSNLADHRVETIARTENAKVTIASRRMSYLQADPSDSFVYEHKGPNDSRTTDTSKRIKRRTRGGVSWQEYVRIVQEESAKDFPTWTVNPLAPLSHWQSRHFPVRIVA